MISGALNPFKDNALERPATGSAFGRDLIGRVLALRVTDMVKSTFNLFCFTLLAGVPLLLLML